jgi:hypothetical protein
MRVRDLSPSTRVSVTETGDVAHLKLGGCEAGKKGHRMRAKVLHPEMRMCSRCAEAYEDRRNDNRHHDFLMNSEPSDLGLSDFGVRR